MPMDWMLCMSRCSSARLARQIELKEALVCLEVGRSGSAMALEQVFYRKHLDSSTI